MLRLPARRDANRPPMQGGGIADPLSVLYDTDVDPGQMRPLREPDVEQRLTQAMLRVMQDHDAPPEAYVRLDLAAPA
jgi:hypothetical protein